MPPIQQIELRPNGVRRQIRRSCPVAIIALLALLNWGPAFTQDQVSSSAKNDSRGRKFVNKIPYDVFFDRPLEMVSKAGSTPAARTNDQSPQPEKSVSSRKDDVDPEYDSRAVSQKTNQAAAQSSGGIQWGELLPMEELQGEVKSIRNRLTNSLKTQGQYRQNFKSIAIDGFEIAALAAIASEHRDAAGWKNNARYVREFGSQIGQSSAGMSKEDFEKTKSAFQRLSSVLDGSIPDDAGDVPSARSFHEVASRKELMKRIERARDWLQKDVVSEAKLKSMSDSVQREAAILAALATVVTTNGYEYTDNDDYQNFARQLVEGAREAAEAGRESVFAKFKRAVEKINKSCTDCHGVYGNG